MRKLRELEEKIYANQSAYDIYDDLLTMIIPLQMKIQYYITLEKYELCQQLNDKIDVIVEKSINDLYKLLNLSNDKMVRELMDLTVNEIRKNINNNNEG